MLAELEAQEGNAGSVPVADYAFTEAVEPTLPDWVGELAALDVENMTLRDMAGALMDFVEKAQQEQR